jgi:hypothetical protein
MDWKTLLASITGTVDQELLLRNEYLVTENRILRNQITGRVRLTDGERTALAEIGQKLGKQALEAVAQIVKPDTILAWHRTLAAQKCDGSMQRKAPGRPTVAPELEALVVRLAREHRSWGYDRIVGALANLGYTISDQTVGNIWRMCLCHQAHGMAYLAVERSCHGAPFADHRYRTRDSAGRHANLSPRRGGHYRQYPDDALGPHCGSGARPIRPTTDPQYR